MILLDENIDEMRCIKLQQWGIRYRKIGVDEARKGIQDGEIASLLRGRRNVTFFTHDPDFYKRRLCHPKCCIVLLNVSEAQAAEYIRRFLRHSTFLTQTQRMGTIVRVGHDAIHLWRLNAEVEETVNW